MPPMTLCVIIDQNGNEVATFKNEKEAVIFRKQNEEWTDHAARWKIVVLKEVKRV